MSTPFETMLKFPESKIGREEKLKILEPFIRRGFHEGYSENMLYEQIKGTTLGMRRSDFLKLATPTYEELRVSTKVSTLEDASRMNIGDLRQKASNLEDRFWTRVRFDYTLPNGESDSKYLTYGFNDMNSVGEIKAEALSVMVGDSIDSTLEFDNIVLEEMYKQF